MRKIFCFIAALMAGMNLLAVDVIVLRNSTRIDAKIIEVSETEIRYKKANNPDGPVFVQKVEGISAIVYENGDVTSYTDQASAPAQNAQSNKVSNSANQSSAEKKESKVHMQFNPQPSDNYWIGLTLGYMSKNMKATAGGVSVTSSFIFGEESSQPYIPAMRFGLTLNPTFKYGIGLRTGLFMEYGRDVVKDGGESSNGIIVDAYGNDITLSIPLQVSYRYEIIPKVSVLFYTGLIFDFGAYCAVSYGGNKSENMYSYVYDSFTETSTPGYSGFNCLWGIGAGVQWDRLRLDVGGEFGMVNKFAATDGGAVNWNKPVYVTLTCFF